MPVTTRSRAKQTHVDGFQPGREAGRASPHTANSGKRKREVTKSKLPRHDGFEDSREAKKSAQALLKRDDVEDDINAHNDSLVIIIINRAPVLELWGATVTQFLYPKAKWDTCLSAGSAISSICAISKGKAIGTISQPDPETAEEQREERRKHLEGQDLAEINVMNFKLRFKDGLALVGDKPKKANEATLRKKFGEAEYESAHEALKEALQTWQDHHDELNAQAFGMYETFRPVIKPGAQGWGRKGELDLEMAKETIRRPP